MAIYRTVNSDTWDDPWFTELVPDAKLLFLYMITNRRSTPCGVFEITLRAIAFETGLDTARVSELLPTLEPKIVWWADLRTVWVRNFYKHQRANSNDKFAIAAAKSLYGLPPIVQCALLSAYHELEEAFVTLYPATPLPPLCHPPAGGDSKEKNKKSKEREEREDDAPAPEEENEDQVSYAELDELFDDFWEAYPDRKGRKAGPKDDIKTAFAHFPTKDWSLLVTCARNYRAWCAEADEYPVDPIRFFKSKEHPNGLWRDYKLPVTVNGGKRNGAPPRGPTNVPKAITDPDVASKYAPGGKYEFLTQGRKGG